MDNMIRMMEKYASNLEGLVQQRTGELLDEKKKTEMLLYRMLPAWVINTFVAQLRRKLWIYEITQVQINKRFILKDCGW